MDIHEKSVDMDADMDGKFHIHGKPGWGAYSAPPGPLAGFQESYF